MNKDSIHGDNLYFKRGRRYYPVPATQLYNLYRNSIPVDGIWSIKREGREATRICSLPTPLRIQLEPYKEPLMKKIQENLQIQQDTSINAFASMLLQALTEVIEETSK